MRVLLVSTYELGHVPLGLARPAGLLAAAGHEVRCVDLAVDAYDPADFEWPDAIGISVPMHTALRLAVELVRRVRRSHQIVPVALFGLYAGGAIGSIELGPLDLVAAGELDDAILDWLERADTLSLSHRAGAGDGGATDTGQRVVHTVQESRTRTRPAIPPPDWHGPLGRYARLSVDGEERLAGYVESTRGCSHRCRHCPVPVVYNGRTRVVELDTVLREAEAQVRAGARHLTIGDPDFLNRPQHARRVSEALHESWPEVSFDVTVKVEHVLRHETLWPRLAAAGCIFVVSAFESADDRVLRLLDKGHTAADAVRSVEILRRSGIEPRPTFLPFSPWTTFDSLIALTDLVADNDLVWNVDPVQYSIRLLLPKESLLLTHRDPELDASLGDYALELLGWRWEHADPSIDALQTAIAEMTEEAAAISAPTDDTFCLVRESVYSAARRSAPPPGTTLGGVAATRPGPARPRLTESWFCCAEPTSRQLGAVTFR